MGSSPGGNYAAPNIPAPTNGPISAGVGTSPFAPNFASFLPQDPTAMATGLTPEMIAATNRPAAAVPSVGSGGGMPGLLQAADIARLQQGTGFKTTPQAEFLLAMGANPKTLLGDKYEQWAAQPVTRGTLAAQMSQGKTRGREVGGHR